MFYWGCLPWIINLSIYFWDEIKKCFEQYCITHLKEMFWINLLLGKGHLVFEISLFDFSLKVYDMHEMTKITVLIKVTKHSKACQELAKIWSEQ